MSADFPRFRILPTFAALLFMQPTAIRFSPAASRTELFAEIFIWRYSLALGTSGNALLNLINRACFVNQKIPKYPLFDRIHYNFSDIHVIIIFRIIP